MSGSSPGVKTVCVMWSPSRSSWARAAQTWSSWAGSATPMRTVTRLPAARPVASAARKLRGVESRPPDRSEPTTACGATRAVTASVRARASAGPPWARSSSCGGGCHQVRVRAPPSGAISRQLSAGTRSTPRQTGSVSEDGVMASSRAVSRTGSSGAPASAASRSARSAARVWPSTVAVKTRRTPETVPWTRIAPSTLATRWALPVREAASASRSAGWRIRRAQSARRPLVRVWVPVTSRAVVPCRAWTAQAAPVVPSGARPTTQGRPEAWVRVKPMWSRSRRATGAADGRSGRATNQGPVLPGFSVMVPPRFRWAAGRNAGDPHSAGECRIRLSRSG
ncbi:hypothetical protein SGLAM104S_00270 [Streptomyces glaucescens]